MSNQLKQSNQRKPQGLLNWRPAPITVVLTTTVVVIASLLGIGWLNARRYRVRARVEIAEPQLAQDAQQRKISSPTFQLPNGEVERIAVRVREVAGLLYGLTTLAVTEQIQQRRVTNVQALLQLLTERNLSPPGMSLQASAGALMSARATLYVRYRPQPFGLEIVSVGHERLDGPAIIGRLDGAASEATGAVLLIAKRTVGTTLPAAFAPLEQTLALGWQMEALRPHAGTEAETQQLEQWAHHYATSQ